MLTTILKSAIGVLVAWTLLSAPTAAQVPGIKTPAADAQAAPDPVKLQDLIDVLRNEKSREALLSQLEAAEQAGSSVALQSATDVPLGQRIAELTRDFAERALSSVVGVYQQLVRVPVLFSSFTGAEATVLLIMLRNLALVIVATHGTFYLLRLLKIPVDRRLERRAHTARPAARAALSGVSLITDIAVVFAAWAVGYLAALTVFGELGRMDLEQTLYLNAFTVVQALKVITTKILSPSNPDFRLLHISTPAAERIYATLAWITGILGYGQLLFQPVLAENVSPMSGHAVSVLAALIALAIAIAMTLRARSEVADWLLSRSQSEQHGRLSTVLASRWHWPVLAYLGFLFFTVLVGTVERLFGVLGTSIQAFAAIFIGWVIADRLAAGIAGGVRLPDRLNARLPLLERRVNGVAPKFLTIVRMAILALVIAMVAAAIGLFDPARFLATPLGLRLTGTVVSVILVLVCAYLVWLVLSSWVDYRLNPSFGTVATSRETTLLSLFRNAATIIIVVVTLMFTLSELGLDIAPLLASAGVLGLAIGFGAQKLVQDVINGVFIQLENAINVGDVITVGGITGTVERLTIRSVSLRDVHGSYHIISFSSVDIVTNLMRDFSFHVADIGVAYRENVEDVRAALTDAFTELRNDPDLAAAIIDDLEWFGVQSLADSAVVVRVRIKTLPGKQWAVGRAFNAFVKQVFDARDIEMPFPHQTVYFGVHKDGTAPAANMRLHRQRPLVPVPQAKSGMS